MASAHGDCNLREGAALTEDKIKPHVILTHETLGSGHFFKGTQKRFGPEKFSLKAKAVFFFGKIGGNQLIPGLKAQGLTE